MAFHQNELIGKEVCVEMDDSSIITGTFDTGTGNWICIRNPKGEPFLFHERFVRAVYLKPEKVEAEDDN